MKSKFTFLLLALFAFAGAQRSFSQPDQKLTHDIFKELIEINTSHSVGNTTKAAEAMAARLKAAGYPDKDLFVGGPNERKGNLVAILHGSGKKKPLLLVAHIDVVEALASDWTTDPFRFQEIDGY